jgi:hypothetical protein
MLERLVEAAGRFEVDAGEVRAVGDESLIALRLHGLTPSGFPGEYDVLHGHEAVYGLLTRVRAFGSMDEALGSASSAA